MARRLRWTAAALADLLEVQRFIAVDSPYHARVFAQRVRDAAKSTDRFTHRGRVVPELANPAIRELLLGDYRLIYKVEERQVVVLAVIHGARDFASAWMKTPR